MGSKRRQFIILFSAIFAVILTVLLENHPDNSGWQNQLCAL